MVAGMHRRSSWIGWVAVGAVVAVGVSGCADEAQPSPPPEPSVEASWNDETLLSAADATITQYAELLTQAFVAGEVPDEMFDIAGPEVTSQARADALGLVELGYSLEGPIVISSPALVDHRADESAGVIGQVVACFDTSQTSLLDAAGAPVERGDVTQRTIRFDIEWNESAFLSDATYVTDPPVGDVCG